MFDHGFFSQRELGLKAHKHARGGRGRRGEGGRSLLFVNLLVRGAVRVCEGGEGSVEKSVCGGKGGTKVTHRLRVKGLFSDCVLTQ